MLLETKFLAEQRGFAVIDAIAERRLDKLVEQGPVLVAVDDMQWMDPFTITALRRLVGKFSAAPVVWMLTMRSECGQSANGLLIEAIARDEHAEWLPPLRALPDSAVAEIVRDVLGAEAHSDLVSLCANLDTPREMVEFVHGLREDHAIEFDSGRARLAEDEIAVPAQSPCFSYRKHIPARFQVLIQRRLTGLSPASRQALQVAAVLGRSFRARDLAEMLGASPAGLLSPLSEALSEGILTTEAEEFIFRRELIWRAVVATVPKPMRALLHSQAAQMVLAREGMHTGESAAHLVHCARPDDAEALRAISQTAARLRRVAPETAAELASRGMELTAHNNPEHLIMAHTAMTALLAAGYPGRSAEVAEHILRSTAEDAAEPARHARNVLAAIMVLRGETDKALALVPEFSTPSANPQVHGSGRSGLIRMAALALSNVAAAELAADKVLSDRSGGRDQLTAAALTVRALAEWHRGRIDDAFHAVDEAAELSADPAERALAVFPQCQRVWMLVRTQQLDQAETVIASLGNTIEADGLEVLSSVPPMLQAWVQLGRGDLTGAEVSANDALARCRQRQVFLTVPPAQAVLALTALQRGDLSGASERARQFEESIPQDRQHPLWHMRCLVTAQVAAARGATEAAVARLLEAGGFDQLVSADPLSTAWCVRLALDAGRTEFARELVEAAESLVAINPNRTVLGVVAGHARALLDRNAAEMHAAIARYTAPWVRASAEEDLGVMLSGTDREEAVAALTSAMTAYLAIGADWDAARVRGRLRELGIRRRHWHQVTRPTCGWASLTDTEAKVARLVATGLTNRQVARDLFISPHTVGFHLRQIYRKLAIQSRVDLARIAPATAA